MNRIMIFAYNENTPPGSCYRGYFDGTEFIPKLGYCDSLDDLYKYKYIQIFGKDGLRRHIPKRFYGDLTEKMHDVYKYEFGEREQITIFDVVGE